MSTAASCFSVALVAPEVSLASPCEAQDGTNTQRAAAMGKSANLPPAGARLPLSLGASLRERTVGKRSRSPRQIATLAFAHKPEKLDLSQPALLTPSDAPDKVGLHYHGTPRGGVQLAGTRARDSSSAMHDYVMILRDGRWWLEQVSDVITGIKPVVGGAAGSVPAPFIPADSLDADGSTAADDPDEWALTGAAAAAAVAEAAAAAPRPPVRAMAAGAGPGGAGMASAPAVRAMGGGTGMRSRPVSPSSGAAGGGAIAKQRGGGKVASAAQRRTAGKAPAPGMRRGGEDGANIVDAALDEAMGSDDDEEDEGPEQTVPVMVFAGKTVAGKKLGRGGESSGSDRGGRGGESSDSDSGSSGSGSNSDDSSSSGSSGSDAGSESENTVEYTSASSDEGG